VYAARAKVVVVLNFLLPALPYHQRPIPSPTRNAVAVATGAHYKSCGSGGAANGSADRDTDDWKHAAEGDRKLPADDGQKRRANLGQPESDPTRAHRDKNQAPMCSMLNIY
jgi:hypothetical protein